MKFCKLKNKLTITNNISNRTSILAKCYKIYRIDNSKFKKS